MSDEKKLRAWRVDECDIYSGVTAEEAVAAAMADTMNPREAYDANPREVGPEDTMHDGEPGDPDARIVKIRDYAASMSAPGLVCSTEW
jgi:hypothetical protein